MAHLIRSAKSGSDWTSNELYAYNISIKTASPADFFQGHPDPSLDHLDPHILTSPTTDLADPSLSATTSEYLGYLDLATRATQESAIIDFAAATLRLLEFRAPNITVATPYAISLTICAEMRVAQADVYVVHGPSKTILLVLVGDKAMFDNTAPSDVEAQVVAAAIAAFQFNNGRRSVQGRPTLEAMTIPCITMSGTTPTFYLVPVTQELSDAVVTGQHPASETQVLKCVTVAAHQQRVGNGMADVEFRKIALTGFLAFKELAKTHWEIYMTWATQFRDRTHIQYALGYRALFSY